MFSKLFGTLASQDSPETSVDSGNTVSRTEKLPMEKRNSRSFVLGMIVVVLSLISGFTTYLILTGLTPIIPTHQVVVVVLLINVILVLAMIGVITWQVWQLWRARKKQAAGARLHVRIVSLFSVIAVIPAILLAVFASISLDRGLDSWFSTRTKSIVQNSINVALAYVREHGNIIRADVLGMGAALDEAAGLVKTDPKRFGKLLKDQASLRSLPTVYMIDETGRVRASAVRDASAQYLPPPKRALKIAEKGQVVVVAPGQTSKVRAILKLKNFRDTYLYVLRSVDPVVTGHLRRTRAGVDEFNRLEQRRTGVQVAFAMMYLAIALTLLLAAIWLGLWFANLLVAPIRRLIGAAEQVSKGDLDVQLEVYKGEGDLGQLSSTFNDMTLELKNQRNDLMDANFMLDDRRRFMEAVLSGVTAGVIGLDVDGKVTLANRSAEQLLGTDKASLVLRPLGEAVPEFAKLFKTAEKDTEKTLLQDQVTLFRDGLERNLAVRFTKERSGKTDHGYVVTFDDITELVSAQRTSAWADVARRIAHEIKNPLTPIQLAAERLRRKYGDKITEDRDVFDKCTETIIRQVGDIGRMVDEFSSFARMPKPVMEELDIGAVVKEAVFLFQVSHPEITIETKVPEKPLIYLFDRQLISQAITNLVKNASEAIAARSEQEDADSSYKGRIITNVGVSGGRLMIEVIDNGCGLPKKDRNRLIEPYMTTREKGTGLGLAIVQKITEQHGGTLRLEDAPKRDGVKEGACIRMSLLLSSPSAVVSSEKEAGETSKTLNNKSHSDQGALSDGV